MRCPVPAPAGQGGTGDTAGGPSRAGRGSTSPWHLPWSSEPRLSCFPWLCQEPRGAGLCHSTSGLSLLCRGGLSSSTGASTLGLPLAVQWEMVLSLSFCPFILLFVGIWALCIILKDREGAWLPSELRGEEPARWVEREGLLLSDV